MDGGVIVVTEQTNKKLMLDESPDMPLQFKWRKFGGAIFTATQTMEHVKEGRKLGPRHCCKVSDEAAFCLIQRPYISKTLLTRRISPRGSP
ncbi:hypothetical protein D7I72_25035 [Salmonella enterica]|nr:hypothetical protein [Salmonella enterica]